MVVFISTVLSPSGPEVAGAVCFCAALLRLARQEAHPPWLWVALGASGAVLSAARALGPGFVLLAVASIALLVGPGRLADRLRAGGVRAAAAGLAILVACGASLIWEFTYQPRPDPNREGLLDALEPSVSHLPAVAKQAVGIFGSLDAPMPAIAYVVWAALVVALTVAALASGSRRDRLSLVGLAAAGVGVTIVMSMVYREIGVLHGRYVLPFLVLIPLWTGEVVLRSRARLPARALSALVAGTFLLAGAVQMLGWWASARRFAVGEHGSWLFLGDAEWSPPLGWGPWFVIATLAAAAYVGAGAAGVRSRGFTRPADRV